MIENYYEFLYVWGIQGIIFLSGIGLGIAYATLKYLRSIQIKNKK